MSEILLIRQQAMDMTTPQIVAELQRCERARKAATTAREVKRYVQRDQVFWGELAGRADWHPCPK